MDLDAQRGGRILEERKRLNWSQQAAADAAGIRREMWARYEAGAEPGAKALTGMAAAGADVLYILTGQRSAPLAQAHSLAADEKIMLDNYRHAPDGVKSGIKTTLGAFAPGASAGSKRKAS